LRHFLKQQREQHPEYWNLPVPNWPIAPTDARLLIVGLAPGLHGANRTGIPFTGDASGDLLFKTLTSCGLAPQQYPTCITNAVKCVPPGNKPNATEMNRCRRFLRTELSDFVDKNEPKVVLCLGRIAHEAVLKSLEIPLASKAFHHGAEYDLPGNFILVDSFHCSRYNINTGRLSEAMFLKVINRIAVLLDGIRYNDTTGVNKPLQ